MGKAAVIAERRPERKPRVAKQVWLDPEQRNRLKTFARQSHLSESEVARRAIDTYILRNTIRRIEAECIAQHGEWDWELLPEDVQDEYDGACVKLSLMEGPGRPWTEFLAELAQEESTCSTS
jgi:predicted transcriptional regulator